MAIPPGTESISLPSFSKVALILEVTKLIPTSPFPFPHLLYETTPPALPLRVIKTHFPFVSFVCFVVKQNILPLATCL